MVDPANEAAAAAREAERRNAEIPNAVMAGQPIGECPGCGERFDYGAHTGADVSNMDLSSYELQLLKRVRQLDQISLGLTVSGPAYQDNPILYANQTFRRFTGYELATLVGENPRLLQGPDSESDAVGTLREGIEIWEARTVELWNYRRDGSRFRNRVSVVPLTDESGMITNWLGVQRPVDT